MRSSHEVNIEDAFCEYLKRYHKGSANPVSSKTLEAVFHLKGTEIRKLVNSLRCQGKPICSDYYGYYYAANQREVDATVAQLSSRINQITKARDGLLNQSNQVTQVHLSNRNS